MAATLRPPIWPLPTTLWELGCMYVQSSPVLDWDTCLPSALREDSLHLASGAERTGFLPSIPHQLDKRATRARLTTCTCSAHQHTSGISGHACSR